MKKTATKKKQNRPVFLRVVQNVSSMASSGVQNIADFASQVGRRSLEVLSLTTGPRATSLLNSAVARARSRHAVLTNPYAKRAIDLWVSNVVGNGHRMVSSAPDTEFKKKVEDLWEVWVTECDYTNQLSYSGIEAMAFRAMLEGGDSFVQLVRGNTGLESGVPLQLRVFESEQVPITKNETINGRKIVGGIEYDAGNRPLRFHFLMDHPGDVFISFKGLQQTVSIPAKDIIHLMDVRRPGQGRGLPVLSQVIVQLSDLDRYLDAEMQRKKAASLIGGFIRKPAGGTDSENPFSTIMGEDAETDEITIEALEPGTFPILPVGWDVTMSQPADSGQTFETFLRWKLLQVASGLNLLYEQITGDYSKVNDRTMRVAMLEFKRLAKQFQATILVHMFHRRIFKEWFNMALVSGALEVPPSLNGVEARKSEWISDPWQYMNPMQEITAEKEQISALLKSTSSFIKSRGQVPDDVFREIAEEHKKFRELGLVSDTDRGIVSKAGIQQQEPEGMDEDAGN